MIAPGASPRARFMTELQEALFHGSEAPSVHLLGLGHISIRVV